MTRRDKALSHTLAGVDAKRNQATAEPAAENNKAAHSDPNHVAVDAAGVGQHRQTAELASMLLGPLQILAERQNAAQRTYHRIEPGQ
jgi:hypothetical protein